MKHLIVERSPYLDSVSLMRISKQASETPGVSNAIVAMATDTNLMLLKENGFDPSSAAGASPDNLVIAVEAATQSALDDAVRLVKRLLAGSRRPMPEAAADSTSLEGTLRDHPEINLVFISIPGRYAAYEATKALRAGRHVMIFSDNVSVEDEARLKAMASERGLLVMGPDCGTAIIDGVGLGFANKVPRGPVGIVAASGTGAQEVSSILARLGVGISQLIGTGTRDVSAQIRGRTMKAGLRLLVADGQTSVVVVVSKLPDEAVARDVLELLRAGGKPSIVYFAGRKGPAREGNVVFAATLEATAVAAAQAATGRRHETQRPVPDSSGAIHAGLAPEAGRKFLRGLYSGGTLAQEALMILGGALGPINTNIKFPGMPPLEDPAESLGHTIVDLGDDRFTRGRAHPMIDQAYRLARLRREHADPDVAVILMDVVLGYGANSDPGGEIAGVLRSLRDLQEEQGTARARDRDHPIVIASICGTADDPQGRGRQRGSLEAVGAIVADTNAAACDRAAAILGRVQTG